MAEIPEKQLLEWKARIEREIQQLEESIKPLTDKLLKLREQHRAIQSLIPTSAPKIDTAAGKRSHVTSTQPRGQRNGFAPADAYWLPILESLIELGGRSESDVVLNSVQKKMIGILTTADFGMLPSGISVRWRNRAQWQRKNMASIGLMRHDSPRGIWEITDIGRDFVARARGII